MNIICPHGRSALAQALRGAMRNVLAILGVYIQYLWTQTASLSPNKIVCARQLVALLRMKLQDSNVWHIWHGRRPTNCLHAAQGTPSTSKYSFTFGLKISIDKSTPSTPSKYILQFKSSNTLSFVHPFAPSTVRPSSESAWVTWVWTTQRPASRLEVCSFRASWNINRSSVLEPIVDLEAHWRHLIQTQLVFACLCWLIPIDLLGSMLLTWLLNVMWSLCKAEIGCLCRDSIGLDAKVQSSVTFGYYLMKSFTRISPCKLRLFRAVTQT